MSEEKSRWEEIRQIWVESATAYRILGSLALVGIGIWIGAHLFAGDSGFGSNIYAEFMGIVATYFIIDFLNRKSEERRRQRERQRELKDRLLREARSPEPDIARNALHEIRTRDLLCGNNGILKGEILSYVQWEKADLMDCNLRGASLAYANLDGAHLKFAKLERANLRFAKLRNGDLMAAYLIEANLYFANLVNANLSHATLNGASFLDVLLTDANLDKAQLEGATLNLSRLERASMQGANLKNAMFVTTQLDNADLSNACLEGANLEDASLTGAILNGTTFDESTVLPNKENWKPGYDLSQFTNSKNGHCWHSDNELSPAFHGELNERFTSTDFWEHNFPRFH